MSLTRDEWPLVEDSGVDGAHLLISDGNSGWLAEWPRLSLKVIDEVSAASFSPNEVEILATLCQKLLTAGAGEVMEYMGRLLTGDIQTVLPALAEWATLDEHQKRVLLSNAQPVFRSPLKAPLEAWFRVFPPAVHLAMPGSAARVLEAAAAGLEALAPDQRGPRDALNDLQTIVSGSLSDAVYGPRAHAAWVRVLRRFPGRAGAYVKLCLEATPPRQDWAVAALEILLDAPATRPYLADFLAAAEGSPEASTPRIDKMRDFFVLMRQYSEERLTRGDLREQHLFALRRIIQPAKNVDRADMFVAAIRRLRSGAHESSRVALEFEAAGLCLALRIDEAERIADDYPGIAVGPRGELRLIDEINRLRSITAESRTDFAERDYLRVLDSCYAAFTRRNEHERNPHARTLR